MVRPMMEEVSGIGGEVYASLSTQATAPSRVELDRRFWRRFRLGVQPLKLRVAMEESQVRVAARPHSVLGACFPGLAQCIHGFRRSFQEAVNASRVVKNRSFVGPQSYSQVEFADSVVLASQFCV